MFLMEAAQDIAYVPLISGLDFLVVVMGHLSSAAALPVVRRECVACSSSGAPTITAWAIDLNRERVTGSDGVDLHYLPKSLSWRGPVQLVQPVPLCCV